LIESYGDLLSRGMADNPCDKMDAEVNEATEAGASADT
jgi:hypothetical protein